MGYYKACKELDRCHELDKYWDNQEYQKWTQGYIAIAEETEYALAECQVGYAYLEGIGVDKDIEKAFYWTEKSANHNDRDGQFNLAYMYENGIGTEVENNKAIYWYKKAAEQSHDLAIKKLEQFIQ